MALSVAGSDPSGGAGLQADLKAFMARGVDGAAVVTALTFQDARGVRGTKVLDADDVKAQLETVVVDERIRSAKTGMLGNAAVARVVASAMARRADMAWVVDPVMRSGSGHPLLDEEGVRTVVQEVLPRCSLLTPNADEAAVLLQRPVCHEQDARHAAQAIKDLGPRAVLLKGGHLQDALARDVLVDDTGVHVLEAPRLKFVRAHGTGCLLSAMIAAELAKQVPLRDAVQHAKTALRLALERGTMVAGVLVPDVMALRTS